MKFPLKKSQYLLHYLVLTAIVFFLSIFYYLNQNALEAEELSGQSLQIVTNNRAILINTINIENEFRGFVLSKDKVFLNDYEKSKFDILLNLNSMMDLAKDNKMQHVRIVLLKKRVNEKLVTVSKNIDFFRDNNFKIIGQKHLFIIEKNETDSIRKLIEEINSNESLLYNKLKLQKDKGNQCLILIFQTILILLIIISILIINSIKNQNIRIDKSKALKDFQKLHSKCTPNLIDASLCATINVESSDNVSSTFSFILPLKKSEERLIFESELLEFNYELKDIKVLVVEDLELNQLLIKTLLDDYGFECAIVSDGKTAIKRLETNDFDIILMDLKNPEMDSFEVSEYIRNKLKLSAPIIALAADISEIYVKKCIEVGMNDYVAKPIDEKELFLKMIALIQKPMSKEIKSYPSNSNSINIDLSYLKNLTKSNPNLMSEMISIYLEQTNQLVHTMKRSYKELDWEQLQASVHKMIPSFSIMGIDYKYENLAKEIQEYVSKKENPENLGELILQLEIGCEMACKALKQELITINSIL